ncbi:MAG: Gfo/Idh/MocA family oxidoreductase, partial [Leptolyngbyaceae bacterium]|nr:Gfo/Idh/MocA family oxidoreductase [Leptolyngbyaceae bacterium]
ESDSHLIVISTMNHLHGAIARAALEAGKHVVVEYPLALDLADATQLIHLAKRKQLFLHVEHIELLSGIHQSVVNALPMIGTPFYVQSNSLRAESSVPQKWSYDPKRVGFPLMGALSRIQRLVTVFGEVETVSCQSRFWSVEGTIHEHPDIEMPYRSCLCSAQLRFTSEVIADLIYGKGTEIWTTERSLHIHGETGMIQLDGSQGQLIQAHGTQELTVASRRGLFAKDSRMVLDALTEGTPMYVTPEQSLYALCVADAARRSALTGSVVPVERPDKDTLMPV